MSPVSRHKGTWPSSAQVTPLAAGEGAVGGDEQAVALLVERDGTHPLQGLLVDVGEARLHLEGADHAQDLVGGARLDAEAHLRVPLPEGRGELGRHGERGGDHRDAHVPGEPLLQGARLLAHLPHVAHDAKRPLVDPLALRGEALVAGAALHEQDAQRRLELLEARRQGGLGDAAQLGRLAEMALARQRDEVFELVDHGRPGMNREPASL
jgi:hypothetical protein